MKQVKKVKINKSKQYSQNNYFWGMNLWRTNYFNTNGPDNFNNVKWKINTEGKIHHSPIIIDDKQFLIVDSKSNFYAIDASNGDIIWQKKKLFN